MSVIGSNVLAGSSGQSVGDYNLTKSLRFRSSASAYLNRTPASAGNRKTFTLSMWVKRGSLSSAQSFFTAGTASPNPRASFEFTSSNAIYLSFNPTGSSWIEMTTSAVYRDVSAWYHVVVAVDTTQATDTNRVKLYVNNVQVTAFSAATYPSQNTDLPFNNNVAHAIGTYIPSPSQYFDGYLAEVNFIDGQALTPSSFGQTSTTTGVWLPKKYTGTYGTNGFYLPFIETSTSTFGGSFNGSNQFLTFSGTNPGSGNFTIEGWVNVAAPSALNAFMVYNDTDNYLEVFGFKTTDDSNYYAFMGSEATANSGNNIFASTGSFSANTWNHVAFVRNSGVITIYINGTASGTLTKGHTFRGLSRIGVARYADTNNYYYLNGSISNLRITTNAVYTSGFTPATTALTAISGTSLLTLQNSSIIDNSTNAFTITNNNSVTTSVQYPFGSSIFKDQGTAGNNWTPNNINSSTAGSTYDIMNDVPTLTSATTANYCVMNPIAYVLGTPTLSGANLNMAADSRSIGTMSIDYTGKWYYEVTWNSGGFPNCVGWGSSSVNNQGGDWDTNAFAFYAPNGQIFIPFTGWTSAIYTTYTNGDIVGVGWDNGTVYFYKNGTLVHSFASNFPTSLPVYPLGQNSSGNFSFNFGQRAMSHAPLSGAKNINTFNLATPTIGATASTIANEYFDINTYTGNGTSQSIVNSGSMQPDFVWIKQRSGTANNSLLDSVRGVSKPLFSDLTNTEADNPGYYVTAFNSNGFSVGLGSGANGNGATYVGWQWRASNATAVTNTAGSITSTVSANTTAGFSIVSYASGAAGQKTVGHGLGVTPSMIITKSRQDNTYNWAVYHSSVTDTTSKFLRLNTSDSIITYSTIWGAALPTSSVFGITSDGGVLANTNCIAYCFAPVDGYSAFGKYIGNGLADGTFVYTGFKPRFLMIKRTNAEDPWIIHDTARDIYNGYSVQLYPNFSNAEGGPYSPPIIDYVSNGFKCRSSASGTNGSASTFIYMAFAENPFKYANAR